MLISKVQEFWQEFSLGGSKKTFLFSLISFLLGMGYACGVSSSNALLISRVGTQPLFYVYLGSSILTFLLAGLLYLLVDRFTRLQVFFASFEILAACIFGFWFYLRTEPSGVAFYFGARVSFYAIFILTYLEFWLIASDYFTNFEAKVRYPYFVAASVAGIMAGSLLIQKYAAQFKAVNFFLLWCLLLALAPFLLLSIRKGASPGSPSAKKSTRVSSSPAKPALPKTTSRLLKLLLLFWLAYTFFGYGVDYFFNSAALKAITDENLLAAFFGKVAFWSLSVVFIYQLFFAVRLSLFLSVERSVIIVAVLLCLGVAIVQFSPSLLGIAFAEGLIFFFLDFTATALLQPVTNIFSEELRGRIKVLIDGFGRPAGTLTLLLVAVGVSWKLGLDKMIYFILGGAVIFLVYPFVFKKTYFRYLLDCLQSEEPQLVLNAIQALGDRDKKKATPALLKLLDQSEDRIVQRNIILSLGRMQSPVGLPKVIEAFAIPQESVQLAVLESLSLYKNYESLFALYEMIKSQDNVSFLVRANATRLLTRLVGKRMIPLLVTALEDEDLRMKANAIESLALLKDRKIIPIAGPYLHHENRRLRANSAIALYPFRQIRREALQVVEELFRSEDPLTRFAGIYAIGELGLLSYQKELVPMLENPDPKYQQQVIMALTKMKLPKYSEAFVSLLLHEDRDLALESIRQLSRFRKHSRWQVFEKISRRSPAEQEKILSRMDETPLDFSVEKGMLETRRVVAGPLPL